MPRALLADCGPEPLGDAAEGLVADGFEVERVGGAGAMLASARAMPPDIVILGFGLPDGGGVDGLRALREFSDAYLIVVVGEPDEVTTILALSMGADDVVVAGTSGRELAARARAMLRRPRATATVGGPFDVGGISVDLLTRSASAGGGHLDLTRIEFDVLAVLAEAAPAVVARGRLVERIWGPGWLPDDHVLDVHVSNLRRKLVAAGADASVVTARGVGFRLAVDD